ncbi:hypothetical protein FEM48_Zijuj09G0091700 [Ziziphus jujuba var. spinosa]|uniref:R13L1/DRL21-like LRR repeat region domain-containing protein n=1 Tax=Ziziphus jujuba var. spinosa TaxID=714518 RepID=A0A978US45_ZIZJJ|nr:hypothetical protein FEM48_Zijuj09G0091700 [Ziziphus jujuba var. spinosa]
MLSIQHLELRDCAATLVHSFQNLTTLTFLVIEKVGDLSSFPGAFPGNNPLLTYLDIKSCPQLCSLKSQCLGSLEISDSHGLMFLPEIGTNGFCRLQTLSIENCNDMTYLSMGLKNLTCLEHLIIMYCPSLVTLPQRLQHLVALQSLTIFGFSPKFMFLPEELQNLKGLRNLEIRSYPGLKALPEWIHKLISLRSLAISNCHKVAFLPEGIKCLTLLQHLSI